MNKPDRLLSEQEIQEIAPRGEDTWEFTTTELNSLFKSQDLKTAAAVNAEWVEWGESKGMKRKGYTLIDRTEWQERKKEIGI